MMNKTKVDDMLMEMAQPKADEIEKKFSHDEGLRQEDSNIFLLKSQYNHTKQMDQKLNEVRANVVSLKDDFHGLKCEFKHLELVINGRFTTFEAMNTNTRLSIGSAF